MPRTGTDFRSIPTQEDTARRQHAAPPAAITIDPAEARDIWRRSRRVRSLSPWAITLSLLAHVAVQLAALLFLPKHAEPPSAPPESTIALVYAPSPAAAPSAAEQPSPAAEAATEAAPTAPTPEPSEAPPPNEPPPPPPVAQEAETPAPTPPPPLPPPQTAETAPTPQAEEAAPVPPEPPPPAPKPPPRPHSVARSRGARTSPHSAEPHAAPSEAAAPAAAGSAGAAGSAALVPPRPVAGMETNRAPVYPETARRRGEQGRVMLRVDVSSDGMPLDVAVAGTSGHPSLDAAAQSAVRRWRFIPATQAGKAIAAVAEVPIRFHLSD